MFANSFQLWQHLCIAHSVSILYDSNRAAKAPQANHTFFLQTVTHKTTQAVVALSKKDGTNCL